MRSSPLLSTIALYWVVFGVPNGRNSFRLECPKTGLSGWPLQNAWPGSALWLADFIDEELERTLHPEEDRVEPSFTLDGITRRYVDPKFNISRKVKVSPAMGSVVRESELTWRHVGIH
eukprot:11470598-Alexandrium_andersonii.AAC.1